MSMLACVWRSVWNVIFVGWAGRACWAAGANTRR
jgi:hypothetical protein